jgi:hypothetical protein
MHELAEKMILFKVILSAFCQMVIFFKVNLKHVPPKENL